MSACFLNFFVTFLLSWSNPLVATNIACFHIISSYMYVHRVHCTCVALTKFPNLNNNVLVTNWHWWHCLQAVHQFCYFTQGLPTLTPFYNIHKHIARLRHFYHWFTRPTHSHGRQESLFSHMSSVCHHFSNLAKQKKVKTIFATGETVGLTEWIIDDTFLSSPFFYRTLNVSHFNSSLLLLRSTTTAAATTTSKYYGSSAAIPHFSLFLLPFLSEHFSTWFAGR